MSRFAGSAESGNRTMYENMGMSGLSAISTTQVHKTLAGVGGAYSWQALYSNAIFPYITAGDRFLHFWMHAQNASASVRFYRNGAVQARVDIVVRPSLYRGDGDALLATSVVPINNLAGHAHWIAIELYAQDSPNGIMRLWVDGALNVEVTGVDTQQLTTADWDQFGMATNGVYELHIDDVVTTTLAEGRLAEMITQVQMPSANGPTIELTPVPAGAGTNWDRVNEIPASQTDYCEASAVAQEDIYETGNVVTSWLSVWCVSLWSWAARDGAIASARLSVSSSAGGAVVYGSAVALPASPSWGGLWMVQQTDPNGGGAWNDAGLNALRVGIEFN